MQINYKTVQSHIKPLELDVSSSEDVVFVRRNIKEVLSEDSSGEAVVLYEYQEAQLNPDQYAQYQTDALIRTMNGEDNTKEYDEFKAKLSTPVQYKNGKYYKAKWISLYLDIIKDFKTMLEIANLLGADISQYTSIKAKIYDATGLPDNAVEMTVAEINELCLFLYLYKEQCFNELKAAIAGK